jgi:hypothetical protein
MKEESVKDRYQCRLIHSLIEIKLIFEKLSNFLLNFEHNVMSIKLEEMNLF